MTELARTPTDPSDFFANHPLKECDPLAFGKLEREIDGIMSEGYNIAVGYTPDAAYDNPKSISNMYSYLHDRDIVLGDARRRILAGGVGNLGINPLKRAYRKEKQVYDRLEPLRDELLFCESQSNSRAWHDQRGRAAALLTIATAHDLDSGDGGRFTTMSGPLTDRVLDFTFPVTGGNFDGLTIREALLKAEIDYSGRSFERATAIAEKRMADMDAFVHAPVSPKFKEIVQYCSDSLGIRSRKIEVNQVIAAHVEQLAESGEREMRDVLMMSYGCGTALPMLEVLQKIRQDTGDAPRLVLIDQDPLALASAAVLAEDMGLADKIEIHCKQLFDAFGRPIEIDSILRGRELDVAEDSGLREYLPDMIYRRLTRMTWKHLRSGGKMTSGNMNINRPQAEFLHGMMGWQPKVQMRQIRDGFTLHEQAGVPKGATTARVTRDGVYTLFFSQK